MSSEQKFKGWPIYLLAAYVVVQFAWWAYMLVDLNAEIYQLNLRVSDLSGIDLLEKQILKEHLDTDLSRRIWMVLGEGSVFLILLILGLRRVQAAISGEIQLAKQQNNFLLSITHELKSPIAAIKLQLQTLTQRVLSIDKQKEILERSQNETQRLQSLVEDLLLTAKIDSGNKELILERRNLSEIVQDFVKSHYLNEIEQKIVRLDIQENCWAKVDSESVESILSNLIDNALKYGGKKPEVGVNLNSSQDLIQLEVSDIGIGVSVDEREKIFGRFYRAGNEETRKAKGTGLGLYIVSNLANQMNGNIKFQPNSPGGSVFVFSIPSSFD